MTIDRILKLIRSLAAHEKSARGFGSVAEADAFAERIQNAGASVSLNSRTIKSAAPQLGRK